MAKKKGNADNPQRITAEAMAEKAGIDRTTLSRMHGRGAIPECKVWGSKPQPHRLYDENEQQAVIKAVKNSTKNRVPKGVVLIEDV